MQADPWTEERYCEETDAMQRMREAARRPRSSR